MLVTPSPPMPFPDFSCSALENEPALVPARLRAALNAPFTYPPQPRQTTTKLPSLSLKSL